MTVRTRTLALALLGTFAITGCGTQIQPDAIGAKYSSGSFEGKAFDKISLPGSVEYVVNDEVYQLPSSQRSFIVRVDKDDNKKNNPDINGVISVPSKDGTLVDFETSTAFKLNTRSDDMPKDPIYKDGGTIRKFYEDICRHYGCSLTDDGKLPEGWRLMLREKFYPSMESAFKDLARNYSGDALVNNSEVEITDASGKVITVAALTHLQQEVGALFLKYLKGQIGAEFFCGPSFDRTGTGCPPIQMLIISADYNNPAKRESREARQVAEDQAAAQEALQAPLQDPNYLEYLRIEAMRECTKSGKAVCVFNSGGGNVPVTVPAP